MKSRQAEVEESEGSESSDSDKGTRQSRQAQSKKVIQTKSTDVLEFRELMDQLMSKTTESTVHDKVRDEQLLEKYMECLPKFDKGHIVAMVMHLLYPKEAMENQGRAISSIFQAIDVKTQGLIELPMASDTETRNQVGRLQASTALACLLRHFYGKDHSSIKKQVQMIQACFKRYPKSIQDPTRFKREVHTELAVYDSLWRFYSKPSDKRETDRNFCDMLLKEVAQADRMLGMQLARELEMKESALTMELLLVKLEENQRLIESLEIESSAHSKAGGNNSSDKKGKQSSANPAIQQQSKPACPECGMEHNLSQCPKQKDRLQKEAKMRGEKLPGSGKSTKRNSHQDSAEGAVADDDSGCFMCFALGKPSWQRHSPEKCFTKDVFTKRLCDPEQRYALLEAVARKPKSQRGTNGSERANTQPRVGNTPRNDMQAQSPQSP